MLEKGWIGKGSYRFEEHQQTGTRVHRIKVDEKLGLIITTTFDGGIQVTDMFKDVPLWSLSVVFLLSYTRF